ncbi:hypothetical protein KR054_007064 [Drosophila jambulina]|nr:hypothetical protein KR054_007064 [Drosophila jambulina]
MDSGIQEFFKNKTVFLTGGSGFLGKVVTEKLLRTTEVRRIYSLIRPKRGVSIGERISAWEKEPIFKVLLKAKPQALKRIFPIAGDCLEPDLGISDSDRELLVSEVQVVIHGAATVRFDEALHLALAINVRATRLMLQLAKQMAQLVSYVHVSTAYSNCVVPNIEERFYPEHLKDSSDKILALNELLSNETIDSLTTSLKGPFPNTYTYTKALAEDVIRREAGDLPLCVFRPAIIMSTYKEPIVGWTDNLYGPMALTFGSARGVVRVVMLDPKVIISMVPVDFCGNAILACAWHTGRNTGHKGEAEKPTIYTLASSKENQMSFGSFIHSSYPHSGRIPLTKILWYPFILCISPWLFPLAAFLYHTLPGYFLDALLLLMGRKPILTKLYRKIHKNIAILGPFTRTSFNFGMENTQGLLEAMSEEDRGIYGFDMDRLDWTEYIYGAMNGLREFIGKEPLTEESIAKGLKLMKRLKILHYGFIASLVSVAVYVMRILAKRML